jgi:hypothetical protein
LALFTLLWAGARQAPGDVLVTKGGTRYEGTVTEQGDNYVLTKPDGGTMTLPKSMVREVVRGTEAETRPASSPAQGETKAFADRLRGKVLEAARDTTLARTQAKKRQDQERIAATPKPDPAVIKEAAWKLAKTKELIAQMMKEGSQGITYFDAQGKLVVGVTRATAKQDLEAAEQALRNAQKGGDVPPELLARHEEETKAYAELEKSVHGMHRVVNDAEQAVTAAKSDPEKLKEQTARWEKQVGEAVDGIRAELARIREKYENNAKSLPPASTPAPKDADIDKPFRKDDPRGETRKKRLADQPRR